MKYIKLFEKQIKDNNINDHKLIEVSENLKEIINFIKTTDNFEKSRVSRNTLKNGNLSIVYSFLTKNRYAKGDNVCQKLRIELNSDIEECKIKFNNNKTG